MAGIGPYGIEQVDVPGVIGAYQAAQGNRIKLMVEQKQLETMERQMAIQSSMAKAAQGFMANFGNASGSSSGASGSASGASGTPSGPSPAQVSSAMDTAASVPAVGPITSANAAGQPAVSAGTMGSSLNMPPESYTSRAGQMLGMMAFLSPEQGQAMAGVFSKMDDAQLAQWKNKNQAIVGEMAGLLQVPYAQRKAAIQQAAGDLQQLGYTPQQIAGFDPTDGNIRMEIGKHTDADHIAAMVNPTYENMRAGGAVARILPDGQSDIPAQSPIVNGPHGSVYPMKTPSAPTATDAKGNKVQWNGSAWVPMNGGQTPSASGGFQ